MARSGSEWPSKLDDKKWWMTGSQGGEMEVAWQAEDLLVECAKVNNVSALQQDQVDTIIKRYLDRFGDSNSLSPGTLRLICQV